MNLYLTFSKEDKQILLFKQYQLRQTQALHFQLGYDKAIL
jgi:hypothetical protein